MKKSYLATIIILTGILVSFLFIAITRKPIPLPDKTSLSPKEAIKIDSDVLANTLPEDKYSEILNAKKKVIFFSSTECPAYNIMKFLIKHELKERKVANYYEVIHKKHPEGMAGECKNKTNKCFYNYLLQNCDYPKFCIIHPQKKEILILDKDPNGIADTALNLKNW